MTTDDIITAIRKVTSITDLDLIGMTIVGRKRALTVSLRHGDVIKFAPGIRPTYLRGLTATVVRVNDKSVTVDCPADTNYGRFCGSRNVRLPMSLVGEKVPQKSPAVQL